MAGPIKVFVKGLGKVAFPEGTSKEVMSDAISKQLDMSEAARFARAKEQGFNIDDTYIHNTQNIKHDFDFDLNRRGDMTLSNANSPGVAMTSLVGDFFNKGADDLYKKADYPGEANIPVKLPVDDALYDVGSLAEFADELENHAVYDMGIDWNKIQNPEDLYDDYLPVAKSYVEKLESKGYKGVSFADEEYGGKSVAIFQPKNVRSIHAAFDPAKKGSSNLLASVAGGAVGLSALGGSGESYAESLLKMPPQQTIEAAKYPVFSQVAELLRKADTPIGPLFEALPNLLDKWAYGAQDVTLQDQIMSALEL